VSVGSPLQLGSFLGGQLDGLDGEHGTSQGSVHHIKSHASNFRGDALVACYVAYVSYLVLAATDHAAARVLGAGSLLVTTLVGLGLAVSGYQGWRRHRAGHG
jgi:hypothetical protein